MISPDVRRCRAGLGLLAALALSGCASTGGGFGTPANSDEAFVTFDWHRTDDVSGTMTAYLADGQIFDGPYFQITQQLRLDQMDALWDGWLDGARGWRYRHSPPGPGFLKHYSGRILANLHTPDGERMRCRLRLLRPARGMSGGGEGVCQLLNGTEFDVFFPSGQARPRVTAAHP